MPTSVRRPRQPLASQVDVEIERLAAGGDGIGRAPDGRALFVPLSAPGDLVRARITEERARFARGEIVEVLRPSPDRILPACPVFGACGGCSWQHLDYSRQLAAKRDIVADALVRIGKLEPPESIVVVPSPRAYGYRVRARLLATEEGVGYRLRGSHRVCAIKGCPILHPDLEARLAEVAREESDTTAREAREREIELSLGASDHESVTRAVDLASHPNDRNPRFVQRRTSAGELRISPGVFYQANGLLEEELLAGIGDAAGGGGSLVELFAGAGFLTLALARSFERVIAVESNPAAVADLRHNLRGAKLSNVRVVGKPVEQVLADPERWSAHAPDVLVLDPPRTGLASGSAEALAGLAAERIVYLSCDAATFARDLRILGERGYELRSLRVFDLFPQTPHVEVLGVLTLH